MKCVCVCVFLFVPYPIRLNRFDREKYRHNHEYITLYVILTHALHSTIFSFKYDVAMNWVENLIPIKQYSTQIVCTMTTIRPRNVYCCAKYTIWSMHIHRDTHESQRISFRNKSKTKKENWTTCSRLWAYRVFNNFIISPFNTLRYILSDCAVAYEEKKSTIKENRDTVHALYSIHLGGKNVPRANDVWWMTNNKWK